MRQPLTERYRERLAGVLSCYDRIIVTGTLPGACCAKGMTGFLDVRSRTVVVVKRQKSVRITISLLEPFSVSLF